jgi:hypothetical protein
MTPRQLIALQTLKDSNTSLRNSGNPAVAEVCAMVSLAIAPLENAGSVRPERIRKAIVAVQGCAGLDDEMKRKLVAALSLLLM